MFDGVKGNRNVITQSRTVSSDFDEISVSHGIEVRLTISDVPSLSLEADENLHDLIITEVEDGVLRIYSEKNIWSAKSRKIYLSTSNIVKIKASSGSNVISENTISTDELEVNTSSGADVNLTVDVSNLTCNTSSGSVAKLKGATGSFNASSSSGSDIKADELTAKTCIANVSSGANISVFVTEKLDANASSGGDIKYFGDPEHVEKNSSSGGKIRNK